MFIVDAEKFVFERGGKEVPYYQMVVLLDIGYRVMKITGHLYEFINAHSNDMPMKIDGFLYDEYGRVDAIKT